MHISKDAAFIDGKTLFQATSSYVAFGPAPRIRVKAARRSAPSAMKAFHCEAGSDAHAVSQALWFYGSSMVVAL